MSSLPLEVVLQELRDFTVQIRHATTDDVDGTGIVVSLHGQIVTCAHVVHDAGLMPPEYSGDLGVYFPKRPGRESKAQRAKVFKHFPDKDDDVVILQLIDGSVPLSDEQIAVLGQAKGSINN